MHDLVGFGCDRRKLQEHLERVFEAHDVRRTWRRLRGKPSEKKALLEVPAWADWIPYQPNGRESIIEKAEEELIAYVKKATGQYHFYRLCHLLKIYSLIEEGDTAVPGYSPAFDHHQFSARHYRRAHRAVLS
jgi:hypothetical protein